MYHITHEQAMPSSIFVQVIAHVNEMWGSNITGKIEQIALQTIKPTPKPHC